MAGNSERSRAQSLMPETGQSGGLCTPRVTSANGELVSPPLITLSKDISRNACVWTGLHTYT